MKSSINRKGVYFTRRPSTRAIKIGWSECPPKRVRSGNTWSEEDFIIEAVFPSEDPKQEGIFHARFAKYHIIREWFRPEPELERFIKDLRESNWQTVQDTLMDQMRKDPQIEEIMRRGWSGFSSWDLDQIEGDETEEVTKYKDWFKGNIPSICRVLNSVRKNPWEPYDPNNIDKTLVDLLDKNFDLLNSFVALLTDCYKSGRQDGRKLERAESDPQESLSCE